MPAGIAFINRVSRLSEHGLGTHLQAPSFSYGDCTTKRAGQERPFLYFYIGGPAIPPLLESNGLLAGDL